MEIETMRPPWVDALRFHAWCDTCGEVTESDDTTSRWCLRCGDKRDN